MISNNKILICFYLNYLLNILNGLTISYKNIYYFILICEKSIAEEFLEENILFFGKLYTVLWYRIQLVIYDTL